MCGLFDANMRQLRSNWSPVTPWTVFESVATDMGSVSQVTPSIHPGIAIASPDAGWHSPEVATAAAWEQGHKAMMDGAKAMAMTTVDLILRPEVLMKAKKEFEKRSEG